MGELRLRPLRIDDEAVARALHEEMRDDSFSFLLGVEAAPSWLDHLAELESHRLGRDLPADRVPATFLVADVEGEVVGRVSIRHELNDFLRHEGGHVGYGVARAHRRRGYATEILRQSLVIARSHGVDRVLVTCDDGNVGSATVIERCGGVLESTVRRADGRAVRRYWIE